MKITEVLVAEHTIFLGVFDQVERLLPQTTTVTSVRTLADLVRGMLEQHGETECELAYLALDHVLAERGELDQLHQDHAEIDCSLQKTIGATHLASARGFLQTALARAREHFAFEEARVFPLLEAVLHEHTLEALGGNWQRRKPKRASREAHEFAVTRG